jgi:hypothetical protein
MLRIPQHRVGRFDRARRSRGGLNAPPTRQPRDHRFLSRPLSHDAVLSKQRSYYSCTGLFPVLDRSAELEKGALCDLVSVRARGAPAVLK